MSFHLSIDGRKYIIYIGNVKIAEGNIARKHFGQGYTSVLHYLADKLHRHFNKIGSYENIITGDYDEKNN
jgi:hypothetical protein